ncbi:MAG TPA: hypothetical protein VF941_03040 [Clostridia bacterium]
MKFSKAKEEQLKTKIVDIILKCVMQAKEAKTEADKMAYVSDWYIMEKVFYADLVSTPKEWFLLGKLVEEMYDVAPKALATAMQAAGIIKDDSKASKCYAYWEEKYGKSEALILSEKLATAFTGNKYSLENIKSMGDKMEIMRGNNKDIRA